MCLAHSVCRDTFENWIKCVCVFFYSVDFYEINTFFLVHYVAMCFSAGFSLCSLSHSARSGMHTFSYCMTFCTSAHTTTTLHQMRQRRPSNNVSTYAYAIYMHTNLPSIGPYHSIRNARTLSGIACISTRNKHNRTTKFSTAQLTHTEYSDIVYTFCSRFFRSSLSHVE